VKALVLLSVLAVPLDASAKCAPSSLRAAVLTPKDSALAAGGGIVVAAESFFDDGHIAAGDVAVQKDWRFRSGKDRFVPKIDVIAPGLAVYRPNSTAGSIQLEDGKQTLLVTTRAAKDAPPVLGAPAVKQVISRQWRGRKPSTEVVVTLDGAAPATAVAIIAYDAKGKALSFGAVTKDELLVYSQHRCETLPDGTTEPAAKQRITLAWVDASGRVSPKSKPIVVGSKVEGKGDE
jgi:hypothetical protein